MKSLRFASPMGLAVFALLVALGCSDQQPTLPDIRAAAGGASGGVSVTATVPDSATQDTTLDVVVNGSGFDQGSQAQWAIAGVPAPKVRTNSTQFVTSKKLIANITIAIDADPGLYDVIVTASTGKKGIGSELFTVKAKGPPPPAEPCVGTTQAVPWSTAHDIAYVSRTGRLGSRKMDLMVIRSDDPASRTTVCTQSLDNTGGPSLGSPNWNPSALQLGIAFDLNRGVYLLRRNQDGSSVIPATALFAPGSDSEWSPDGTKIAYTDIPPDGSFDIYVRQKVSDNPLTFGPAINISQSGQCFLVATPSWAPDSRRIVAHREPNAGCPTSPLEPIVYDIDPDGDGVINTISTTLLTRGTVLEGLAVSDQDWARTGDRIAVTAGSGDSWDLWIITLMSSGGVQMCNLTQTPVAGEGSPSWSPDDRQLAFMRMDQPRTPPRVLRRFVLNAASPRSDGCPTIEADVELLRENRTGKVNEEFWAGPVWRRY